MPHRLLSKTLEELIDIAVSSAYLRREEEEQEGGGGGGVLSRVQDETSPRSTKKPRARSRRKAIKAPSVASSSTANCTRGSSTQTRLKRAFLVGRRGGLSTPVPGWKVFGGADGRRMAADASERHHHSGGHWMTTTSARKLAASLWELQEVPFSRGGLSNALGSEQCHNVAPVDSQMVLHGQYLSPASSHVSHGSSGRSAAFQTKYVETKKQQPGFKHNGPRSQVFGVPQKRRGHNPMHVKDKSLEIDVQHGPSRKPTTTSELMKVLKHVQTLEEQHAATTSLVATLQVELEKARIKLQQFKCNDKVYHNEFENMTRRFDEERAVWRAQQEENISLAVHSIMQELEDERSSKHKLELLHKRVARDLHDVKKTLSRALQDLEKEQKARELMEDVCDELAKEVGEDKARVEELTRESIKVREEVEEERQMLQMAEIWREERVQMKLMEAKLELEEKNTALDKLRTELESFLRARRGGDLKDEGNGMTANARPCSIEAIVGYNLADSFYAKEPQVSGQSLANFSRLGRQSSCNIFEWDEDCSDYVDDGDDDLHAIGLNNVKPERAHHSFQQQQQGMKNRGRSSTDRRSFDRSQNL